MRERLKAEGGMLGEVRKGSCSENSQFGISSSIIPYSSLNPIFTFEIWDSLKFLDVV
jgi:hypothetical protein